MIYFWFDKFKHDRASHRIRAYLPVKALNNMNVGSRIINSLDGIKKQDIVIFTKDSDVENMLKAKQMGITVGFDLCDNKFEEDYEKYHTYCKEVDFITVNSLIMQQVVKEETGRDSFYYIDPVDRPIKEPKVKVSQPIKLAWYGGSSSNKHVDWVKVLTLLKQSNINYNLTICVNNVEKLRSKLIAACEKNKLENQIKNITHYEWTYEKQERLVDEADIVFLPIMSSSELSARRTKTKSHNRLVDGIALGKFVISSPLASYEPLKNYCWLGDPVEGIRYYIKNQSEVKSKIIQGQKWIEENVSADVAAKQLIEIYNKLK